MRRAVAGASRARGEKTFERERKTNQHLGVLLKRKRAKQEAAQKAKTRRSVASRKGRQSAARKGAAFGRRLARKKR